MNIRFAFCSGIVFAGVCAFAAPMVTQRVTLRAGWNAVYAEVAPTGSVDSVFSEWPTDSVGLYDPGTLLSTAQFSAEAETLGLAAAPFATWKRGFPELSDAARIAAGTVLVYFGTNKTDFVTTIVGVPAAPRMKWHESGTSGLLNYVGFSLKRGETVSPSAYLDGFGGETIANRTFYRIFGMTKGSSPQLVKVGSTVKVGDGDVLATSSAIAGSWSGVLFVSPRSGLDFGTEEVKRTLTIRNDGAGGRVVKVELADDAANRPDVVLPWTAIHVRDEADLATDKTWKACTSSTLAQKHLEAGETWRLQVGIDRRQMQDALYGKKFGVILRITDESGGTKMRADVPLHGETSGGVASARAWPGGLWVADVALNMVKGPKDASASETGGTLKLRLPLHVDAHGKVRLLQRVVAAGQTDEEGAWDYRLYAGKATPPGSARSVFRISAVCLPVETPVVEAAESDLAAGKAKFAFTVSGGGSTSLLRHPYHPQHDGLRWDFKTEAPSGDDWQNYKSDVKPETFSVKSEITLTVNFSGGEAVWSPENEVGGTCTWSLEGLRHEGAVTVSGKMSVKRVSPKADIELE